MCRSRIAIVGFMASGKTTIGISLANLLGTRPIDLDELIAESAACDVPTLLQTLGEPRFRDLEMSCLDEALKGNKECVVSLGGGAWIMEENRKLLSEFGFVSVWVDTPLEICWQRINLEMQDSPRPLVPNYFIAKNIFLERRAAYSLADIRIEPGAFDSPNKLAAKIVEIIRDRTSRT